jgi:hypothetical protein
MTLSLPDEDNVRQGAPKTKAPSPDTTMMGLRWGTSGEVKSKGPPIPEPVSPSSPSSSKVSYLGSAGLSSANIRQNIDDFATPGSEYLKPTCTGHV